MQDTFSIISLQDIRVYYGAEGDAVKRALDGVSLTLKRGEWLSIVGANGSGKSTLAGVLLGFIRRRENSFRQPYYSGCTTATRNSGVRGYH